MMTKSVTGMDHLTVVESSKLADVSQNAFDAVSRVVVSHFDILKDKYSSADL